MSWLPEEKSRTFGAGHEMKAKDWFEIEYKMRNVWLLLQAEQLSTFIWWKSYPLCNNSIKSDR